MTDYERLLRLEEMVETLRSRLDELESKIDEIFEILQIEIAQDRKRITALENRRTAGDVMESRAEVLRSLLIASGGKMLRKDARNRMGLSEPQFTYLLNFMKDEVGTKQLEANKKYTVIYLVDASC
jgi:hypothetical protein